MFLKRFFINLPIRNTENCCVAAKFLPYRGLGNGIRRTLNVYPEIELVNSRNENLFTLIIKRPTL